MMMMQAIEMHNELVKKYCNESYYKLALDELRKESINIKVSKIIMYIINLIDNEIKESIEKGLFVNIKNGELTDIQRNRIEGIAKRADDYFGMVVATGAGIGYCLGGLYGAAIGMGIASDNEEENKNKYITILNNCIKAYTDILFENNYMYM